MLFREHTPIREHEFRMRSYSNNISDNLRELLSKNRVETSELASMEPNDKFKLDTLEPELKSVSETNPNLCLTTAANTTSSNPDFPPYSTVDSDSDRNTED